jgi:nucleoside-diphosphate-sugar epimerase
MTGCGGAPPLAAVTGGTGFLGRHVVQALARDGWRLRLLARRPAASPVPPSVGAEVVPGDLDDPAALRRLVEGARAVVHVAGLTKALRASDFMAVNRDGGARLAAAATAWAAPNARFVLVSSQAAREPRLSPYAASKRAGEEATVSVLGGRMSWVVLRPPVIYGPWDREGLALLRLARAPVVPVPLAPEPRLAMVHAADAAAAVAALCREDAPSAALFEITDGRHEGHPWREILRLVAGLAGRERPPRFLPVPDAALLAAGAAADAWAAATGRASLFGRGKAREFLHRDWGSAPERQPPPAVWAPRVELESGLRETLAWWCANAGGGASAPVGGG